MSNDLSYNKEQEYYFYTIYSINNLHLHLFTIIYRKQNPAFGKLIYEVYTNLIMCSKFNIVNKFTKHFSNLFSIYTKN